jgi:hypothetical protein
MPAAPGAVNKFDLARQRAGEQANSQAQQQNDSIRRRFASLGNLNSGAAIKQEQISADNANKARADAVASIDAEEASAEEAKNFQREQMKAQQDFQAGQSGLDRAQQEKLQQQGFGFQGGENALARRLQQEMQDKGFTFQGGESALQRALAEKMQGQQFNFQSDQQNRQNDFTRSMSHDEANRRADMFRQQMEMAQKEFDRDGDIMKFNQSIALLGVDPEEFARAQSGQPTGEGYSWTKGAVGSLLNPYGWVAGWF